MTALSLLPSFRRQNLRIEFAALKHVQLQGIYLSLTPHDPSIWTGTIFVRKGPYAPAIFRFRVSFPAAYPFVPPIITFNADIFHPLLTPLTTYTYASSSNPNDTPEQSKDERLPPGAFSLRYGFASWIFNTTESNNVTLDSEHASANHHLDDPQESIDNAAQKDEPNIIDVVRYIRQAFEDENFLDSLPIEAVVNPSAWYAWQSHRGRAAKRSSQIGENSNSPRTPTRSTNNQSQAGSSTPQTRPKHPSEWNWEGVWTERVQRAVQNSLTENSLYGTVGTKDDDIHFVEVDEEGKEGMREEIRAYANAS